ncbi:MAG TPA: ABC transporter permease [Usitatibacter sp.]|nr:ABC transporter permease [Usitatibacter sp.]
MVSGLGRRRWLLYELTRREVFNRHAGSLSGVAWTVLQPLAQLAIFSFIFSHVFRASVPSAYPGVSYTAFVAVALWPWIMFSEGVQRGLAAVTANAGLVKKVAMPSELFVYASVAACYAVHAAGFLVVLIALRAMGENIQLLAIPYALLLLVPYALLALAVALVLSALHTLLKDVEHVTSLGLMILFYASPVLYSLDIAPAGWRDALGYSPLAYLCERLREVLLAGSGPVATDVAWTVASVVVLAAALWCFRRLAPYFEDFL